MCCGFRGWIPARRRSDGEEGFLWPRVVVEEEGDGRAYALDPSRSLGMTWDRSLARGDATCGAVFGDGFRLGGGNDE